MLLVFSVRALDQLESQVNKTFLDLGDLSADIINLYRLVCQACSTSASNKEPCISHVTSICWAGAVSRVTVHTHAYKIYTWPYAQGVSTSAGADVEEQRKALSAKVSSLAGFAEKQRTLLDASIKEMRYVNQNKNCMWRVSLIIMCIIQSVSSMSQYTTFGNLCNLHPPISTLAITPVSFLLTYTTQHVTRRQPNPDPNHSCHQTHWSPLVAKKKGGNWRACTGSLWTWGNVSSSP